MKKRLFAIIFILFVVTSCIIFYLHKAGLTFFNDSSNNKDSFNLTQTWSIKEDVNTQKKSSQDEVKKNIEKLRKRFALKWLISLWDSYSWNGYYLLALKKYLEAYKKNPQDENIIHKIWDTYFSMKKYNLAYKNYKKIKDYNNLNKDKAILALLYHKEISRKKFDYFYKEMESFNLWEQKLFYYKTVLTCIEDFHSCKKIFQDYIYLSSKDIELIEELQNIKNAIENYKNFKVDQVYYGDALLVWSFFQNELYPISIHLWKEILEEKHDYKPILKIIWKSYFELWDYEFAKKYLSSYYELQQDDVDAIYLLWIINLRLKNYVISNIFLNKALNMWHEDDLNIKRSLVFNYYELWSIEKTLEGLKYIIENIDKITIIDFKLAIYHHIIHDKIELAESFAIKALEAYPKEVYFYGYLWWIYIQKWDLNLAEKNINNWLELDTKNTMLLYYKWVLEIKKWNNLGSIIYFKKVLREDKDWEFWKLSRKRLDEIKSNKK